MKLEDRIITSKPVIQMQKNIFLITISLNKMAGGLERNIVSISNHLSKCSTVTLISFDFPDAVSFFEISKSVRWVKIGNSTPHRAISFSNRLELILRLRRLIKDSPSPTVIVFHHGILLRVLLASLALKSNIVVSERNALSLYKHTSLRKWNLNFLALHLVKKIVVQFLSYKNDYPITLRHKIVSIPNATNFVSIKDEKLPAQAIPKTQQVLAVGRLCAQKQFEDLISAFANVSANNNHWNLVILGDGDRKPF